MPIDECLINDDWSVARREETFTKMWQNGVKEKIEGKNWEGEGGLEKRVERDVKDPEKKDSSGF